jgi:hypothetical protein
LQGKAEVSVWKVQWLGCGTPDFALNLSCFCHTVLLALNSFVERVVFDPVRQRILWPFLKLMIFMCNWQVLEIRPRIAWDKGKAVEFLLKALGEFLAL